MLSKKTIETCKNIQKKYGKSYALATIFFSKDQRIATYILYAFFRIPDEMVDNPDSDLIPSKIAALKTPKDRIETWTRWWKQTLVGDSHHPVLDAAAYIHAQYQIPVAYSFSFLDAMIRDTVDDRYQTYEELQTYMYGSASCVGLMMAHVIGVKETRAYQYAKTLGEAMQLTNFLRDIGEDYDERKRIYIPQEEMTKHGVTEEMIAQKQKTKEFIQLVTSLGEKADKLYDEAQAGIDLLHWKGRFAVRLAARLYAEILQEIKKNDNDVLTRRASTSTVKKTQLIIETLWKK